MNVRSKVLLGIAAVAAIGAGVAGWWRADAQGIPISAVSHIHGIAVDPKNPDSLYLATHHGVFHTSPDGTAELISDNRNDYMGFTPHPSDAAILYASGHPAGGGNVGVLVSRDSGRTWKQVSPGAGGPVDFHAMDVSQADPKVIYGLYGGVQVSRDGGETWAVAGAPPADVFDLAASALSPDIVYAATRNGLMVSRNAGETWEPTGTQGQPATMVQVAPDKPVYAFVLGFGLMKSPGAALDWRPVNNDFGERVLLHLAIDPSDPNRMFAVTDESAVLASTDGGKTWQPLSS
jgi:photosystem II stability/assembly factor-like uncharacterized protein